MTDLEILKNESGELLDIIKEFSPFQENGTLAADAVKPCILEMINFIIKDKSEAAALCDWMDETDFWTAPASTKFHGNFKCGLSAHSLMVVKQSLYYAPFILENFNASPEGNNFTITTEDIFVAALVHDFCKTNFYQIEYRNTKDISGNWIKQPFYKAKGDNRSLGHGNESVLLLIEAMPSYIKNRVVLEAVSRHMGFSDLSVSEGYNYSNFLQNPLVVLLQLADETAAQWYRY